MKISIVFLLLLSIGAAATGYYFGTQSAPPESSGPQPLYWVAPMDPNYRRPGPGKSPMGMDLIPVYETSGSKDDTPGTVHIDPAMSHNLGIRTARVTRDRLSQELITVGSVRYNENTMVHIHPRVEGWVEKLHIKAEGDPVRKGQLLYELYSPELVNAQEELLLSLQKGNQTLMNGTREKLRALQFTEQAISDLITTGKVSNRVSYYAPQDGIIDHLAIREGFFVQPGTTMMSIGSLGSVWVDARLPESEARLITTGDRAEVTVVGFPGRIWQGMVDYVYPTLDPRSRTLQLRISLENPDQLLRPEMYADIRLIRSEADPVLLVPTDAIIRTADGERVVATTGDGEFSSRQVITGQRNQQLTEIVSGLQENELIVTSGQFLIDSESSRARGLDLLSDNADPSLFPDLSDHNPSDNNSAQVSGEVEFTNRLSNQVQIQRSAISKWGREPASVSFIAATQAILDQLHTGDVVDFTFTITAAGDFVITEVAQVSAAGDRQQTESTDRPEDTATRHVNGMEKPGHD
ncbi:MAG: efflux RND transporter periplasmic adaptor subunit [Pseudomonadales bacterium]|nr:efflux RND transporter periplasmic adaptor subunit [Pseudomonadales bacterium]